MYGRQARAKDMRGTGKEKIRRRWTALAQPSTVESLQMPCLGNKKRLVSARN